MSDFDDVFAPLEPKALARCTLPGVKVNSSHDVVLIGRFGGQTNTAMTSASLKATKRAQAQLAGPDSPARREVVNGIFASLLARHALTGWENVVTRDGKPDPFTRDRCEELLVSLAKKRPDIAGAGGFIDRFFGDPSNFCDADIGTDVDSEALGKG